MLHLPSLVSSGMGGGALLLAGLRETLNSIGFIRVTTMGIASGHLPDAVLIGPGFSTPPS